MLIVCRQAVPTEYLAEVHVPPDDPLAFHA